MTMTTMKVSPSTRDQVNTWAREHAQTVDQALADLVWRAQVAEALERLDADPAALAEARAEARAFVEPGVDDGLTDEDRW